MKNHGPKNHNSNGEIEILVGDITKQNVDAIVNAANTTLLGGGGVDGAIHTAAGPELLKECEKLGGCSTGKAKITKGFNLPAKWVIHTVGPVWSGGQYNEKFVLTSCYQNCLKLAEEYQIKTLAFPSISTGAYRFPITEASEIALREIKKHLDQKSSQIEKVFIVCFDEKTYLHYISANK